jgi:hypothetical protein
MRCHELFRHPGHTLLMWAPEPGSVSDALGVIDQVQSRAGQNVPGYVVTARDGATSGRVLADADGHFASAYGFDSGAAEVCLVRPDGYIGYRSRGVDIGRLLEHLRLTMRLS